MLKDRHLRYIHIYIYIYVYEQVREYTHLEVYLTTTKTSFSIHSLPVCQLDGCLNEAIRREAKLFRHIFTKLTEYHNLHIYVITKPENMTSYKVIWHHVKSCDYHNAYLSLFTMAVWMSWAESAEIFHSSWRAGLREVVGTGEVSANTS